MSIELPSRNRSHLRWCPLLIAVLVVLSLDASALSIGTWSNQANYDDGPPTFVDLDAAITTVGQTHVQLPNLSAGSLASVEVLWIFNMNNTNHVPAVVSATADIEAFVAGGGVLMIADWSGGQENRAWLGLNATTFTFDPFSQDLTVLLPGHPAVDGPGGIVTNTILDSLSSSSHGYASLASLPASAQAILSQAGDLTRITDFTYPYGSGHVYYSNQPMPFKLERTGYLTNLAAYTASLVPEPATGLLVVIGLGVAGLRSRA